MVREPYARIEHSGPDDCTVWPYPCGTVADLEWTLRYGTPQQVVSARMTVASVVAAYVALVNSPKRKRDAVVRCLREAAKGGRDG